jgi:hypothetical protein
MNRIVILALLFAFAACKNDPPKPRIEDTKPAPDAPIQVDTTEKTTKDVGSKGKAIARIKAAKDHAAPVATRIEPAAWDWSPIVTTDQYFTINETMVSPRAAHTLFDGNITTAWHPGWDAYPATVSVDFTLPLNVTRMNVYDETGDGELIISSGVWSKTVPLSRYKAWHNIDVGHTGQVWKFTLTKPVGARQVPEIEVFASDNVVVVPPDPPGHCDTVYVRDTVYVVKPDGGDTVVVTPVDTALQGRWTGDARRIGWNAFHWTKFDLLKQVPNVRIWWDLNYSLTPHGIAVNPFHAGSKPDTEMADDLLARLKAAGVSTVLCLENWPYYDRGGGDIRWSDAGQDSGNPDSYNTISKYVQNIVWRYHSPVAASFTPWVNQVPRWNNDRLNEAKKGLKLVEAVEIENEPNRWWKGDNEKYTFAQYSALLHRTYKDAKAIAPVPVVMGGLSEPNVTYLVGMKLWFDAMGLKFQSDAVNVHYYANVGNADIGDTDQKLNLTKEGCAPEVDRFAERMARVVAFAKPLGIPVWLTEFGYDTDPVSVQRAPAFGPYTAEDVAGLWTVRTILEGIRVGVSRFYVYNSIDEPSYNPADPNSGGLYRSHGLATAERYGQVPKKNWYWLQDLIGQLNGYTFAEDLSSPTCRIMRFKGTAGDKYAYWLPVARQEIEEITLPGAPKMNATEKPQFYVPARAGISTRSFRPPSGYSKPKSGM